jgi:glycosyltransferase involved in cell wall biosynthesis
MKVLFLPKYSRRGASSRQRIYQYLPYLENNGIKCYTSPFFSDEYLIRKYRDNNYSISDILWSYLNRLRSIIKAGGYDILYIQGELYPYLPSLFEKHIKFGRSINYIVDYDDAIYHRYDRNSSWLIRNVFGEKIKRVMSYASLVIAGNSYIADYAMKFNNNIAIVPTVVDTHKYTIEQNNNSNELVVGWIGSPTTSKYIKLIEPALMTICEKFNARLVLVGSGPVELNIPSYEIREWFEEKEVGEISSFDIGIMPLVDSDWEQGKSGYKLIQYMACGKPVVASPVGVNNVIVKNGVNGYLAKNQDEWVEALALLLRNQALRQTLGTAGSYMVRENYSLQVWQIKYLEIIRSVINNNRNKAKPSS